MPKKQTIPTEIQAEVKKLVDEFNTEHFKKAGPIMRAFFGNKIKPVIQSVSKENIYIWIATTTLSHHQSAA